MVHGYTSAFVFSNFVSSRQLLKCIYISLTTILLNEEEEEEEAWDLSSSDSICSVESFMKS